MIKKTAIKIIKLYQYFSRIIFKYNVTPLLISPICRFYPSCSEYSIEAINKYGFWVGTGKGLLRILKCNPFYKVNTL